MKFQLSNFILHLFLLVLTPPALKSQGIERKVGGLREVFAWRQLTYDINGQILSKDQFEDIYTDEEPTEFGRRVDSMFSNNILESEIPNRIPGLNDQFSPELNSPLLSRMRTANFTSTDQSQSFFIQYNNLPMGVEKVGNRLFVTVPRRAYGIPSTLNYIDLTRSFNTRSPALKPYPDARTARSFVNIYRTRADECSRLWAVDTGYLDFIGEKVTPPAIIIFDLNTDRILLRYQLKSEVLKSDFTPAGLASITVDITNFDCQNAYAYIPDLATNTIIVYSLLENDCWSLKHNYFYFNPSASTLNIGDTQSTMHDFHPATGVMFFAEIGRNAVSCWNTRTSLSPSNVAIVAQDSTKLIYPSDVHVTGDEVWVMANSMPKFIYSKLDTSEHNFFIYRGSVQETIFNTPCAAGLTLLRMH